MFRSPPPRGRVRRLLLPAAFVVSALVAPPATAAEPGPTESPTTAIPAVVDGLGPLRLPVPGGAADIDVVVVDRNGAAATWKVPAAAAAESGFITVDLAAPDHGTRPVNGPATVTMFAGGVVLAEVPLVVDLDPSAPHLAATAQREAAVLTWEPVSGPGPVTYRVQRLDGAGAWTTVVETPADRHVDRGLEPGRYRYRLSALVAGAGDGPNESMPSTASIRVTRTTGSTAVGAAPAPVPKPTIPALPPKPEARAFAATGRVGETITPLREKRRVPHRTGPRLTRSPVGPPLGGSRSMPRGVAGPLLAAPPTAAAPAPVPAAAAPSRELLPVAVPPAGTLMVDRVAARAQHRALVLCAVALLVIVGALQVVVVALQRRRRQLGGGRSPVST